MRSWTTIPGLREFRISIPLILGFLFAYAHNMNHMTLWSILIAWIIFSGLFVGSFYGLEYFINRHTKRTVLNSPKAQIQSTFMAHFQRISTFSWNKRDYLKAFLCIELAWLPYVIALFPGTFWSDTSTQLLEYYGAKPFLDHHPFLLTLLYGTLSDFGKVVFGNGIFGLYPLVLFQIIAGGALCAYIVLFFARIDVSPRYQRIALAFFALFPLFPLMFVSQVKDSLSAVFFMAFCIIFIETLRTQGEVLKKPWVLLVLFITSMLCIITKKPMVFVIVPSMIMLCAIPLKRSAKIMSVITAMGIALITFVVIPRIILPLAGAQPGGKQESIPVPIQQVAYSVITHPETISEYDRDIIDQFLIVDYKDLPQAFSLILADNVKGFSLKNPHLFDEFMQIWRERAIKHPKTYFYAWMGLVHGWFSFENLDNTPNYAYMITDSQVYYTDIDPYMPEWPKTTRGSNLARTAYDTMQSIPGINILFQRSFWTSIVPCFVLFYLCRPRKGLWRRLISIMPINMTFLYLMLVPVSGFGGEPTRYLFQMTCIIPLFLGMLIATTQQENIKDKNAVNLDHTT